MTRGEQSGAGPWLFQGAAAQQEGDWPRAVEIYKGVAAKGDPRGDTALGVLVTDRPELDAGTAVDAFGRAIERGDVAGLVWMGDALWVGRGVPADPARAFALFERASDSGSAPGSLRAGELLMSGDLGRTDTALATDYWRRCIALGREPAALLALAETAVARGEFVEATGWAIRASYLTREMLYEPSNDRRWTPEHDVVATRERLARQLETAMDLINHHRVEVYSAAKDGDAEACWHWARITTLGFGDVPDSEEGRTWLKQAAEHGHAAALLALAHADRRDDNMVAFESNLRAAAQQGYPPAVHDLGFALHSGAFADGADLDGAIMAYRSIAGTDHPATATDLSFVLEDVPGDEAAAESVHWLRVAADASDVAALRRLGERLRDGDGVEADRTAAAHRFLAAYYLGWDEGLESVAEFAHDLDADAIVDADRAANGSGFASYTILES